MKIAIIGAGLSGTNLYNLLSKDNDVTIFEKSRGTGGRCSTRYIKDKYIDYGTPYFEAKDKEFKEFCQEKVKENILYEDENFYYPKDGINKLCSSLIDTNDLVKNTKIKSCTYKNNKWKIQDENNITYVNFDKLILTIPAPQILELDMNISEEFRNKLSKVTYDSIATLIAYSHTFENIMNLNLLNSKVFKKIVDNTTKYNYNNFSSYVLHLDEEITNKQDFKSKEEVSSFILDQVYKVAGIRLEEDFYLLPHLWRYAFAKNKIDKEYLYDENSSLGICGDYFKYDNLEGSFLSTKSLYEKELI